MKKRTHTQCVLLRTVDPNCELFLIYFFKIEQVDTCDDARKEEVTASERRSGGKLLSRRLLIRLRVQPQFIVTTRRPSNFPMSKNK